MANNRQIRELLDATAYDVDGEKLGSVNEVFINDISGQPDFIEVNHGLFGMSSSLVPLRGHSFEGDELRLAFQKDRIKDAPNVDGDAHLSNEDQESLYRHYGLENSENRTNYEADRREANAEGSNNRAAGAGVAGAGAGVAGGAAADANREHDLTHGEHAAEDKVAAEKAAAEKTETEPAAGNTTNEGEMIRSEERLKVDKEKQDAGEVRLRKYTVHDTETVEVPVEREEVSVERTPISEEEAKNITNQKVGDNDEASVTLHGERVNVSKESVPVEKVNLNKETIQDTETVTEDVAKERIESEGTDNLDKK
ncbi:photosystem reaction center subunit H [Corynebacterium yudongzhengii]|uniref:DUF2382 domain-containing protein n=1 Tax=Corynebacterium yudongzhengii TaxID=2080740 RepID=A0A2U1T4T2_9CORY|nr:PRC and DUF2382 domain-containing protein [Corynebacterium yudongzhengii]AWB82687.1 photosystem reaction center subunit H [Corynebacterium yudongzhengii]PWC01010.1 DUF2382 domain-containing protein [Corynebacterium yudongzhengii]